MLNMMPIPALVETFSATLAPAGTGNLPIEPDTSIMRPSEAGDEDAAALRLGLEELVAALVPVVLVLAVVIPAEHAARDRHAAQAARAVATFRYVFTALNLGRRLAMRMAIVSQACNTVPNPGTAPWCSAYFWRRPARLARSRATGDPRRSANLV